MRILAFVAVFFSFPAFAYNITAVMPSTSGATSCQLYLDGTAAGVPRSCGSAQSYPNLISTPGTYSFTYRAINAGGQSATSPATTVSIDVIQPPGDPPGPPGISVICTDAGGDPVTCPPNIVITITP
jgi:hypothetical protein